MSDLFRCFLIVSSSLIFGSCKSPGGGPARSAQPLVQQFVAPVTKTIPFDSGPDFDWQSALTTSGKNERPSFSKDGRYLMYVSRERPAHKSRQLYEIDLSTREDRRWTYHDGDVYQGERSPDGLYVYYNSTTDEIKDRPVLFYPELKSSVYATADLYRLRIKDENHERLTDHPGFDGFFHLHQDAGKGPAITISRWLGSELQLFRSLINALPTAKFNFEPVLQKPGMWVHSFSTFGPTALRAWIEENNISGQSQISWTQKGLGVKSWEIPLYDVKDLQILDSRSYSDTAHEIQMLVTARLEKSGERKAYWLKSATQCISQILPIDAEILDLRLNNDQKILAWTAQRGIKSQIFMGQFDAGKKLPCLGEEAEKP